MTSSDNRKFKAFEELEYRDDFMFGCVMQDKDLCHDVLECLLQHPVGELTDIDPQREFRYTSDGKPIRLDIYTKDDNDEVFDAEMQNLNHKSVESLELPKRSRFYQSLIDTDHLYKTGLYKTLPESSVLFICTFDPFSKGLSTYTFDKICEEDCELYLGDGTKTIFYNCTYKGNDLPDDLREFYEYVNTGKTGSKLTERLADAVNKARKVEKWRSEYMKEMVLIMDAVEEDRKKLNEANARANDAEAQIKIVEAERDDAIAKANDLEKYKKFAIEHGYKE